MKNKDKNKLEKKLEKSRRKLENLDFSVSDLEFRITHLEGIKSKRSTQRQTVFKILQIVALTVILILYMYSLILDIVNNH